jgi:hypothetical protein
MNVFTKSSFHSRGRRQSPAVVLPMPHVRPCPKCGARGSHWLRRASRGTYVNYFRCVTCGHVWLVPKPGSPREPRERPPD